MSTNGMTSWAVDLKDIGAIYPFQGTETALFVLGLIFWIGWHVWQAKIEKQEFADAERDFDAEHSGKSIKRY